MSLLLIGQGAVGFLAGFFIGLSRSAVVSAVVPAVLALSSGSALSLSVADGTSSDDQNFIGLQLVVLVGGILLGLLLGLVAASFLGKLPIKPPDPTAREHWLLRQLW